MPTHVHLLVGSERSDYSISSFLFAIKRPVALTAKKIISAKLNQTSCEPFIDRCPNGTEHFRFWQRGGGYDRNVLSMQEMHEKIAYIHNNPVKAGLCAEAEHWPWSSASAFIEEYKGPIPITALPL
jgi:putative transposase